MKTCGSSGKEGGLDPIMHLHQIVSLQADFESSEIGQP